MMQHEIDAEINRLHLVGDRQAVVALMRKYGMFEDEKAVENYLNYRD